MKIFDYLDELKSRPMEARKRFAITVSAIFCVVIFIAWLMVVTAGSGTLHYTRVEESKASPLDSITSGFRQVTDEIKDLGAALKGLTESTMVVEQGDENNNENVGE